MPLSAEQIRQIDQWMDNIGVNKNACSECGANLWLRGEIVFGLAGDSSKIKAGDTSEVDVGPSVALVPLTCAHCGHVRFFSAKVMGLVS